MDNPCEKVQEQLVDYILGILDACNYEKVNSHVIQCPHCRQYKQALEGENRILIQYGEEIKEHMTVRHKKAIEALNAQEQISHNSNLTLWRTIMGSGKFKLTAAAVILVAVTIISVSLIDVTTPAYAFEQTIDAIKKVKTVHMAGEFYWQGKFECWLRFDGNPDVPTHMWLCEPRVHLGVVCSPDGLFHFNRITNYVFPISQDQRGRKWIIKFNSFFKDAIKAAGRVDAVTITYEAQYIAVHIHGPKRDQQFLVDPETKLPISFSTIREDDPMEMIKGMKVKNLDWIRYNEEPPDGIFKKPADATIVQNDFDCWVVPDSGLVADGMTRPQACLEIARQTGKALIDLDIEKLCKLDLFFLEYAPVHWDLLKKRKESGPWVDEYVITGDIYEEGEFWYVPSEIRISDGKREVLTMMIKFYEMEGKTICIIVGSKETGVAD
ncbi:MAG: hypothetical protein P8Z79_24155 [Sedimentisphaerales bacterium]|jgi:hypothetical protein